MKKAGARRNRAGDWRAGPGSLRVEGSGSGSARGGPERGHGRRDSLNCKRYQDFVYYFRVFMNYIIIVGLVVVTSVIIIITIIIIIIITIIIIIIIIYYYYL